MRISWPSRVSRRSWRIRAPRVEKTSAGSRVCARVVGDIVWLESDDVELEPAPEAFATLFFIQALQAGARLRSDVPLDAEWFGNTHRLLSTMNAWWGLPARHPVARTDTAAPVPEAAPRVGQCFTGGVDSFHLLGAQGDRVDDLVFVHGFDIPLVDTGRMSAFEKSLREVAEQLGKRAIVVRTNVRQVRRFERGHWEHHTHGAALAAVGHVLSGRIGRLLIPSTWPRHDTRPYGSSWRTDGFWSSSRITIEHGDASLSRRDKIPKIAHDPLAQAHLRVCWQNLSPALNCSRCEKCLRTMVGLARCGTLDRFGVFETDVPLPDLIDDLPALPEHLVTTWTTTRGQLSDDALRAAIDRLLERSPS